KHRHDVPRLEPRRDPLVLAPHARAPRLLRRAPASLEQLLPLRRAARAERRQVVHHLEQAAAARAAIDHLIERISARAARDAAKLGRERHARTLPRGELLCASTRLKSGPLPAFATPRCAFVFLRDLVGAPRPPLIRGGIACRVSRGAQGELRQPYLLVV